MVTINTQFHLAYNLSRKNKLKTSWMKKRVKADVQMVREYLNVIILSLGILILLSYHLLHKLMLYFQS